jgi:hypothetical protein
MIRVLFLIATMSLIPDQASDVKEGWKPLQGTWQLSAGENDGQPFPADLIKSLKLVIKDDPTKKPMTMDVTETEGPNKDKTFPAIYEFSGDKMRVCYNLGGSTRPKEFSAKAGSKQFLATYQKQKP